MKTVGILSLVFATVGAAFRQAWCLRAQADAFTQLARLGNRLLEQIRYRRLPFLEAVSACRQDPMLRLSFLERWTGGLEAGQTPQTALAAALDGSGFFQPAAAHLLDLAGQLGQSDLSQQEILLRDWLRETAGLEAKYRAKSRESGRLWMQLGVFGGLFLWIVLM